MPIWLAVLIWYLLGACAAFVCAQFYWMPRFVALRYFSPPDGRNNARLVLALSVLSAVGSVVTFMFMLAITPQRCNARLDRDDAKHEFIERASDAAQRIYVVLFMACLIWATFASSARLYIVVGGLLCLGITVKFGKYIWKDEHEKRAGSRWTRL